MADRQTAGPLHDAAGARPVTVTGRFIAAILLAIGLTATAAAEEPPIRVVIFEQLMEEPPVGLPVLSNAARQLEREFGPTSQEIDTLARQLSIAEDAIRQAEAEGRKDEAAIARAQALSSVLHQKSEDASFAYQRRQEAVFDPLVRDIDLALQRYGAATEGGDVFLLNWAEFNAPQPGEILKDVSAEFVAWMAAQP